MKFNYESGTINRSFCSGHDLDIASRWLRFYLSSICRVATTYIHGLWLRVSFFLVGWKKKNELGKTKDVLFVKCDNIHSLFCLSLVPADRMYTYARYDGAEVSTYILHLFDSQSISYRIKMVSIPSTSIMLQYTLTGCSPQSLSSIASPPFPGTAAVVR